MHLQVLKEVWCFDHSYWSKIKAEKRTRTAYVHLTSVLYQQLMKQVHFFGSAHDYPPVPYMISLQIDWFYQSGPGRAGAEG